MFETREVDGIIIISPDFNINEKTAIEFKENILTLIARKHYHFLLDLGQVGYITSLGIGVLCDLKKRLDAKNGWIKMACVNEDLLDIFRFTMMTNVFKIFSSVEDALADSPD